MVQSLKAIPTISIVTERDNLFDASTGIYTNPSGRGSQWERPVSVEIIGEDSVSSRGYWLMAPLPQWRQQKVKALVEALAGW